MRSAAMSVSCNTGRGHCLPALFMFCWSFQSLYLTRLLGLSCPGRETRIFPHRERKWGSSRILPCDLQHVTWDDPILSVLAGAVHKQRRWEKSLQGWQRLSVLVKAVESWCGNVGTWFLPLPFSRTTEWQRRLLCSVHWMACILETWTYETPPCPHPGPAF